MSCEALVTKDGSNLPVEAKLYSAIFSIIAVGAVNPFLITVINYKVAYQE